MLEDKDWRVVFTAARSLGWLRWSPAHTPLQRVAESHWLPEVRDQAKLALAILNQPANSAKPAQLEPSWTMLVEEPDGETFDPEIEEQTCGSETWTWRGTTFRPPGARTEGQHQLNLGDGNLIGTNNGEFGGHLIWKSATTDYENSILEDRVLSLGRSGSNAIVVAGLAHLSFNYGYVIRLESDDRRNWTAHFVGALPGRAWDFKLLTPTVFVAWSAGRAIVFDDQKILGMAECVV